MKAFGFRIHASVKRHIPRRIMLLALLLAATTAFQVALTLAQSQSGTGCDAYGSVGGSAYSTQCDAYGVQCDAYSVGCDAYGVGCDAYSVGCDAYTVPGTDLVVSSASIPDVITKGESYTISWQVLNRGANSTVPNPNFFWADQVYLSTDIQLDEGDVMIAWQAGTVLSSGSVYSNTVLKSAANVQNGQYYILIKADGWNSVSESDETNNIYVGPQVTVQGSDPDLIPTALDVPTTVSSKDHINISWTVSNQGTTLADGGNSWHNKYCFSADDVMDSEDSCPEQGQYGVPLAPGQFATWTKPLFIPAVTPGDYYILVKTDNFDEIHESNEENNVIAARITVLSSDLVPSILGVPDTVSAGEFLNHTWIVKNQGLGTAAFSCPLSDFFCRFYGSYDVLVLSTDDTYDSSDRWISGSNGFTYYGSILPGAQYSKGHGFRVPQVPAGEYYLILMTDFNNVVTESDETNNSVSVPITIKNADLAPSGFNVPENASAGETVSASWTVYNSGTGSANPEWTDAIYFSSDQIIDMQDTRLSQISKTGPLANGQTYSKSVNIQLPNAAGTYYLLLKTDDGNIVFESNENNNVVVVPIIIKNADLSLANINVASAAVPGENISASWTVYNQGASTASPSWYDRIYLSNDAQLDYLDTILTWSIHSSALAPGASYASSANLTIPYKMPGVYYLILKTDGYGNVFESDEDNNVSARQIQINNNPPVITEVDANPSCGSASIAWTTDKQSTSTVQWSTASGDQYENFITNSDKVTSHSISISNLTNGTTYYYRVKSTDYSGNTTTSTESSFTTPGGKPTLGLSYSRAYWPSYSVYLQRLLSVEYSIRNSGVTNATNVIVTDSTATQGVLLSTGAPHNLGNITPGATAAFTLQYLIPDEVTSFRPTVYSTAEDECSTAYSYP